VDEYDGPARASIFVIQLNAGALFAAHGQHCHEPNLRPNGRRRVASFDRISQVVHLFPTRRECRHLTDNGSGLNLSPGQPVLDGNASANRRIV
jgi:hypothetical protein